ncbi:SGNH hydrolase domain-containing protein [Photobacterium piscicola]|uniref:SGNH hydrolase domain-containing protein n=1 Tax=Photobacterium piscicola TaxID=1378299 RepID=UPI003735B225
MHFKKANYPSNVHFIDPTKGFCDHHYCYAIQDSQPLYHDAHHATQQGAERIVSQIAI